MNKENVNVAFELLLEEIESVINELDKEAEKALKNSDYENAKETIEKIIKLTIFREKVKELKKEWGSFLIPTTTIKTYKKLPRGLRTPEDEFIIPILESIEELGGKAPMSEVLKKVEQKMRNKLNEYDYEELPSEPSKKRWENTAQWCRNTLVSEGLLSNNSPRGIWEITDKGRAYLFKFKKNNVS
jgi:hypothetical protein